MAKQKNKKIIERDQFMAQVGQVIEFCEVEAIINDLIVISESDSLISFFPLYSNNLDEVNTKIGTKNNNVQKVDWNLFFNGKIVPQAWHDDYMKEQTVKFKALFDFYSTKTTQQQYIKIGKFEMQVYLMGKLASGHYIILKSMVVET